MVVNDGKLYAWWYTYPSEKYDGRLGWLFAIYRKCSKPPTSRYIDQLLSWWIVPHVKTKRHVMGDDSLEVIGMYEQPNNIGYQPKQIYVAAWWSPTSLPFSGICLKPQKAKDQIALFFEHLFPKKTQLFQKQNINNKVVPSSPSDLITERTRNKHLKGFKIPTS